jgi:NTE family protein
VLGGGGSAGNAWLIGVIAGLHDAGIDVTTADLIIGTSAGATAAAQLLGASPSRLLADVLSSAPPHRTGPIGPAGAGAPAAGTAATRAHAGGERGEGLPRGETRGRGTLGGDTRGGGTPGLAPTITSHLETTTRIIAVSHDAADMRRRIGAAALAQDAELDDSASARWRATVAARFPDRLWPERRVLITAVDARTGESVVFDRRAGVDLVDAVAASTSGGPIPYRIGDARYIDGGYRSIENADLAAGFARVLVLSPLGGRSRHPFDWGTHLETQVGALRAAGSIVETVFPDEASTAAFGGNLMDPSTRPPAARAGRDQGRALVGRLDAFWG